MRQLSSFRPGRARGAAGRARLLFISALAITALAAVTQVAPALSGTTSTCSATGNETLAASGSSFQPGDTVHLSGSGYGPGCTVSTSIVKPDGSTAASEETTDATGNLSFDYAVAADAASGTYGANVYGDGSSPLASASFDVGSGSPPSSGQPCGVQSTEVIGFGQQSYGPGETVNVGGLGFPVLCDVTIKIARPDGSVVAQDGSAGSDTVTTSLTGTLDYSYDQNSQAGTYEVEALGANDAVLASGQFSVTAQEGAATLDTDRPFYYTGDTVKFTGTNFASGEAVSILVHGDSPNVPDRTFTSTAGSSGSFENDDLVMQPQDNGVNFTVTATGASGKTASTTFTDATFYFTNKTNGNWNDADEWCTNSTNTPVSCTPTSIPPTSANNSGITVQSGHTVSVAAAGSANALKVNGTMNVNASQTFATAGPAPSVTVASTGTVNVSGTFNAAAGSGAAGVSVSGMFKVLSGGSLTGFPSSSSLTAASGATFSVASGATASGGSVNSALTINSGATATVDGALSGFGAVTVGGSLTASATMSGAGQNYAFTVNSGANASTTAAMSGYGQFTVNGSFTSSANVTIPSVSNLQVGGMMTMTGGTVALSRGNGGSVGSINNNGSLILQGTSGVTIENGNNRSLTVASGGTIDIGPTAAVSGSGLLNTASGAKVTIRSATGVNGNVTTAGTDTYNAATNWTFFGTADQDTGSLFPLTVNDLTISDTGGTVSLANAALTVNGKLTIASGAKLSRIGPFSLKVGSGGVSNAGTMELRSAAGCPAATDDVTITSTDGAQRAWDGTGTFTVVDAKVTGQTGTAAINALSSTDGGNNGSNWHFFTGCTATGTLIVKKVVVNDNGGSKVATDFSFKVNGGSATSFTQDTDTLHGKNTLDTLTPAPTR